MKNRRRLNQRRLSRSGTFRRSDSSAHCMPTGKKVVVAIAAVLLCVWPLCAQGDEEGKAPSSESIERGRTQFVKSCSFCHGTDANGGAEGPNLMRSSIVRHDAGGDLIGPVIQNGRRGRGMPPIPLTPRQISEVVAFLHARLKTSDLTSPVRPGSNYALKRLLTGNAQEGKAYFNGAGGCSACHSVTGDLAGIARKFPGAELQTCFLYPQTDKPNSVTVLLSLGKRIQGELVYTDLFDVGIRDQQGWYHSWPRDQVKIEVHDPLAPHIKLLGKYTNADIHNLFAYLETLK